MEQYISLYADDLLLLLADTEEVLSGATTLLREFGRVSGLGVNWREDLLVSSGPFGGWPRSDRWN